MYDNKKSLIKQDAQDSESIQTVDEEFDFFHFMYPEDTESMYNHNAMKNEDEFSESSTVSWFFEFLEQHSSKNTISTLNFGDNKIETVIVTTSDDNNTGNQIKSPNDALVVVDKDNEYYNTAFNEEPYDCIQIIEDIPNLQDQEILVTEAIHNKKDFPVHSTLTTFDNSYDTILDIKDDNTNSVISETNLSDNVTSNTSDTNKTPKKCMEKSKKYIKIPKNPKRKMSFKTANGIFRIICLIIYFIFVGALFITKKYFILIFLWLIPVIPTDIRFYKSYSGSSLPVYKNDTQDDNLFDYNDYYTQVRIGSCINGIITLIFLLIKLFFTKDNKNTGIPKNNPETFDGFNNKWKETLDNFFEPGEIDLEVLENLDQLKNRQNQGEHYPKQYSSDFERNLFNEKCNVNSKTSMKRNWLKYEKSFKPFIRGNKGYNPVKWIIDAPDTILTTMFGRIIDNQYSMNKKLIPEYERFHQNFIGEENIIRNTEPLPNSINYISHPRNFLKPIIEMNFEDVNEIHFVKLPKNSKITIAIWDDLQEERTPEFYNLMNNIIHWNLCLEIKDYDLITNPEKHNSEIVLLKNSKKQKTGGDKYSPLFEKGLTYKVILKEEKRIGDIFMDIGRYCMIGYRGRVCISPFFGHLSTLNQLRQKGIKATTKTNENLSIFFKWKDKLQSLFAIYKKYENEFKVENEI